MATVEDVFTRGAYILQRDLEDFEREIAEYLGVTAALGVADGTMALTIALKMAGVGAGDEVIVPAHTFVASAGAVNACGAVPVVCDVGADHMIDVESAGRCVTPATRVLMPVQLNGTTADMDAVEDLARAHGLQIVEDSCQAFGARFKDRPAGSFGIAGSFSFYPAKTLGCFGDGGGMIFNDQGTADRARAFRDHGRLAGGEICSFGVNGRMDNVQAAILRIKLRHYNETVARRRRLAGLYHGLLEGVEGLALPTPPGADPHRFDIFQNYEVRASRRDDLRDFLDRQGIGTICQWGGKMLHQHRGLGLRADAPFADKLSASFLLLPLHHLLMDEDVEYVCDQIKTFYRK